MPILASNSGSSTPTGWRSSLDSRKSGAVASAPAEIARDRNGWDGEQLTGVIATAPTPVKRADLDHSPFVSCNYWAPNHDIATADCSVTWSVDDETCTQVWEAFKSAPEPVGYDPAIIPPWADGPTSEAFAVLHLQPYRLRVFPGTVLLGQGGEVLTWRGSSDRR
jgi:hypothetical protein